MPADVDQPHILSRPRLRVLRRSPSPGLRMADSSSEATPQAGPASARFSFAAMRDDEEDEVPTPRMQPRPINSDHTTVPAETPAARLRALLAREPRSPRDTTPSVPPAPPSEADSFAGPSRLGSSNSSVARESLKNIFSRALREPGDTPEKHRQRRNSFDGSSMEITPVIDRDRGHRRASRRSLSDEEAEKPKSSRQSDRSFRFSTAASFDALRARLMASQSQLMDQNLSQALDVPSDSTSYSKYRPQASTSSQSNSTRVPPPVSSNTHPSFQMSSQLAFHSNLLEQDSQMQRAMGEVLNSETEASTSAPNVAQPTVMPSDSHPSSSLRGSKSISRLQHGRMSLDSSTSSLDNKTDRDHRSQEEERSHQGERVWNRPRVPSRSGTPETSHRHSQEFHRRLSQEIRSPSRTKSSFHDSPGHRRLEKRSSIASLRSFDDNHSSRPSSIGSQADYRERISELERERNQEREREWNKRHPPSRPSSSLSTSSNNSFEHSHSHPPRSPSTTPYSAPTHASLQRKSSRSSLRSDSPASLASSHDSLKEREQEEANEVNHERERNWNSPRPHWSMSKSPPASSVRPRNNSLGAPSSLTRLGDSGGLQGTSLKAGPSATSSTPLHKSRDRTTSGLDENASRSTPLNGVSPGKSPGAASKFGWNFARSPLPPLELDDRRRSSPSPGSHPSSAVMSSHIPIRSRMKSFTTASHVTSDMSLTNVMGDESSYQNEVVKPPSQSGFEAAVTLRSQEEDIVLASDEESVDDFPPQSTTPKSNPPKPLPGEIETDIDTDTEILSPSPQGSPRFGPPASIPDKVTLQKSDDPLRAQIPAQFLEQPSHSATPPGTPPPSTGEQLPASEMSPSFALITPPRQTSLGNSILDFRTPSPPRNLPDLPGPPSSSDDDVLGSPIKNRRLDANSNTTLTKTPKPPGAWAATPLLPKPGHRPPSSVPFFPLESTPPAFTSTPLPRASTLPHAHIETEADHPVEDGILTPVGSWSRAKTLPLRTPAPPGAWLATPGQSVLLNNGVDQSQYGSLARRKGLLKVRFDVTESEASATEEHSNPPLSAIRLTNPELPLPRLNINHGADRADVGENEALRAMSTLALPHRPVTPERPTTPMARENPSPRSLRRSPAVRVVDAFGRERVDEEIAAPLSDLPNGHADSAPSTPRRSLVRIVDAMGKEVDDAMGIPNAPEDRENRSFEADVSVVSDDNPDGRADAVSRLKTTLRDLTESEADRSRDLDQEATQAPRLSQNENATAQDHDLRDKTFAKTRGLSPVTTERSWNTTLICCGIIMQLLLILAMWRYANVEARRLFYTTYYDPLYPELTPIQGSSCFSGTLSTSRSWTLTDSYETIRREGWRSIGQEILRVMRHVGEHAWEQWGEHTHFEKPT